MRFDMSYESYIKLGFIFVAFLALILSGSNTRLLNLIGLALNIMGTLFLVIGSSDNLNPLRWSDGTRPNLKRDYRRMLDRDYGLVLRGERLGKDCLSNCVLIQAKYPILRLKAAEFGPVVLFVGFILQFYSVLIDP